MAQILFANDTNLLFIDKFLRGIYSVSGREDFLPSVSGFAEIDLQHKIQLLVLNKKSPSFDLQKALEAVVTNGVIVMNADEKSYAGIKLTKPMQLITYGYNPKSTITASSVVVHENISVQCCIQRQFATLGGEVLEPQEFLVRTSYLELKEDDILAAVTVALLCGVRVDEVSSASLPNI